MGLPRTILEGSVALVAVVRHRRIRSEASDDDVEQAVVVKILHDGPARRVEAVKTDKLPNFVKSANVKLRMEETVEVEPIRGIDAVGILTQRHVRQVEQPTDLEVVGKTPEVLGKVPDCQTRAGWIQMDGGRRYWDDARALSPAHDAVIIFASS